MRRKRFLGESRNLQNKQEGNYIHGHRISKNKNSLDEINTRRDTAKECIHEVEMRQVEINLTEVNIF